MLVLSIVACSASPEPVNQCLSSCGGSNASGTPTSTGTGNPSSTEPTSTGSDDPSTAGDEGPADPNDDPVNPVSVPPASFSSGCSRPDVPGTGLYGLDVNGTWREFHITLPADYDPNQPARVMFYFHEPRWRLPNAARFVDRRQTIRATLFWSDRALVTPEGYPEELETGWKDIDGRDLVMFDAILDWLGNNYCIDRARIFATGFSDGAFFTNILACARGDVVRAVSQTAGTDMRTYYFRQHSAKQACSPNFPYVCKGPVASQMFWGEQDPWFCDAGAFARIAA
ncbi:MAG: hypothetical protein R3A47_07455 [Polyangiales bacterium]